MKAGDLLFKLAVWGPAAIIALVAILAMVAPDPFWHRFVYRYYWGPIVADAGGDAGGLTPDYNWIDTISYGLILAWASFLIHRRFVRTDLRVGAPFSLAMAPIIVLGPAARVLEDMELFNEPMQYLFISPIIYIFLGIATLLTIETAVRIERMKSRGGEISASMLIILPGLLLSLCITAFPGWFNADIPVLAIVGISALMAIVYPFLFRTRTYESLVGWTWSSVLLFVVLLFFVWSNDASFREHYLDVSGSGGITSHPVGGIAIAGMALLITAVVASSVLLISRWMRKLRPIVSTANVLILSGHMLDASATYVGVDHYGYSEKHRLPSLLMESTGTAAVMFPLKLVFLLPAIYYIDNALGDDRGENRHLLALVKLAILVLGFGPGIRDLLRLWLGV